MSACVRSIWSSESLPDLQPVLIIRPSGIQPTPPARAGAVRHGRPDVLQLNYLSMDLGTRVRGAYWLTFLGQPVLGQLGGVAGLRDKLSSPEVTVQPLNGERALVTLGPWPEAGDMESGHELPAYRELARVLEPWTYRENSPITGFTEDDTRRWERRFLG